MATPDPVNTITESLNERDEQPRKQISEIVEVLGAETALELLAETRRVQTEGGLAVRDGTRRRTDGGVFFSLAKAKLPRADRNRIFRVRLPKPPEPENGAVQPPEAAAAPRPARPDATSAAVPKSNGPSVVRDVAQGLGRRRVVEVEVLRQHVKPAVPAPPVEVTPKPPLRVAEVRAPEPEMRPLRRIVVPAAREELPATPEAAQDRVRGLIRGLSPEDQRQVLTGLLANLGPAARGAPSRGETGAGSDPALRERVLASVTEALGLSSADLARALYGDDNPAARSRARVVLERWRKTQA